MRRKGGRVGAGSTEDDAVAPHLRRPQADTLTLKTRRASQTQAWQKGKIRLELKQRRTRTPRQAAARV